MGFHGVPWSHVKVMEISCFKWFGKVGVPRPLFPWKNHVEKRPTTWNIPEEASGQQHGKIMWEQRPTTWNIREEASGQQHGKIMWNNGQPHGLNMPGQNLI